MNSWWAEGDTPVRNDSHVSYLVDARSTLLTMCRHFLMARQYIYISCWGITPVMKLVRGRDHRAGPDSSSEQEALLAELRAEGLQEAEIDFWCANDLTVQAVLGYAVSNGVEVKALIWDCPEVFSHYDPKVADKQLRQVARTVPGHTYSFAPKAGIQGIAQLYAHALGNAQQFIYLENQYFWLHAYFGVDLPFLGTDSPDMERNLRELGAALRRGVTVAIVLPDHPNVGRAFTDQGLTHLRQAAPEAVAEGRLQVFCLATSTTIDGAEHYRPIYVHAKVAIIDDLWSTLGSANLSNKGMRDDTEMNVATLDAALAAGLRMMLLAEHVGLMGEDDLLTVSRHLGGQRQAQSADQRAVVLIQQLLATMDNPLIGLQMMIDCAQDNLRRYKAKQPLVGHLLPYLTAEEEKHHGLHFREAHGWVELAE